MRFTLRVGTEAEARADLEEIWVPEESEQWRDLIARAQGHDRLTIPAEDIVSAEVERNFKLEIGYDKSVLRFDFVYGGSALQWYDVLSGRSSLGVYSPHTG